MKATDIAMKAAQLVGGDRHDDHGDMLPSCQSVAALWNGYLLARVVTGKPRALNAEDVANMMELFKVSRRLNGRANPDDYVDGAGYASMAGEIRFRSREPTL